jgi:hypothetical protein
MSPRLRAALDTPVERQNLKSLIALIARSPDRGEGWRSVSAPLFPLYSYFIDPSLIECEKSEDGGGGRVRLSPKGEIVAPYL